MKQETKVSEVQCDACSFFLPIVITKILYKISQRKTPQLSSRMFRGPALSPSSGSEVVGKYVIEATPSRTTNDEQWAVRCKPC